MSPIRKCSVAALLLLTVRQLLLAQVAFVPAGSYQAGFFPYQVVAADINGDGRPDIVSANDTGLGGGSLTVLTNDGRGNFKPVSSITSQGSRCLSVADFNNDNKPDIVAGNIGPDTISVFTNKGNGIFALASTASVAAHPMSLVITDVNNDSKKDVVVGNYNGGLNNYVSVLTNTGNGTFSTASTLSLGYGTGYSVAAADINEDGLMDIADAGGGYLTIFTNKGSGQFQSATSPNLSGLPQKVIAVDVNGDSHIDLVTANSSDNTLSVVTNDGHGNFTIASLPTIVTGGTFFPVTATDVNGDGRLDLIAGNNAGVIYNNTISVLTNKGSGDFAMAFEFLAVNPQWIDTADFNADGKVDIVAANTALSKILVFDYAPVLDISPSGSNLVVSWPSSWTNWVLQQNSNLATTNWSASSGVSNDGTNKSLTVAPQPGNLLFRLAAP